MSLPTRYRCSNLHDDRLGGYRRAVPLLTTGREGSGLGQIEFAACYDIDHVSAISSPTTEAADLGASIIYYDNQPPAIDEEHALLAQKEKLSTLKTIDPGSGRRMAKRLEVIRLLSEGVGAEKMVEGWIEGR